MRIRAISRRVFLVFVLAALIPAALACGAGAPTTAPTPGAAGTKVETSTSSARPTDTLQPTVQPTAEPTEAPTATLQPQPLYLGDVVQEHGCLLSALLVEDPAPPGSLYEAKEGKKLVAVEVVVGNASAQPLSVNPLSATLVDGDGFVYQAELGGRDGQIATIHLSSGEKVRGWIAFEIPEGATPARVKYEVDAFADEVVDAPLTPPPAGYAPSGEALSVLPAEPEAGLGEVAEGYGYTLSATTLEDPTTPGMLYEPTENYKLVAVEIVVGNASGEAHTVNPMNAILVDVDGFVYEVELGGRDGQIATVELNTGEKAKGWVAFSIPSDATPATIKYELGVFSDEFLQVGLRAR